MTAENVELDWRNPDYSAVFRRRLDLLEKLRSSPEIVGKVKDYYRENPVAFVNDFGMKFDPRLVERGI